MKTATRRCPASRRASRRASVGWSSVVGLSLLIAAVCGGACIGNIGDGGDANGNGNGIDNHPEVGPDGRYICNAGPYPIQSFARRLTISEYQNVIRDVFG